ncbi:MAG: SH3 domain-containing protein [Bacteroidales bacterium]|nr:SH3 domain-containing protein [Bacteroidales bacterium]
MKEVKNYLEVEDLSSRNIMMRVATRSSNLNIRKGPGTQFEIVGKAAHNSQVQLLKKMYNGWYFIRSANGTEGFCSTDYLAYI